MRKGALQTTEGKNQPFIPSRFEERPWCKLGKRGGADKSVPKSTFRSRRGHGQK